MASRWMVATALTAALLVGCGSEDSPTTTTTAATSAPATTVEAAFPVTVATDGGDVRIEREPERIVSLSATATESLYAIGAGDRVVAVDGESDFPPEAPRTKLSALTPNLEALANHRPDLVVLASDEPADVVDGLERLDVPVLVLPGAETLADAYRQIEALGAATGHDEEAAEVVETMRTHVDALLTEAAEGKPLKVFHELSPDLYTASSRTFIGRIYDRMGLRNVADPAARRAKTEYPQMSPEAVVAADPDLVVLADADCCDQTPKTVAARDGWQEVSAVRHGNGVMVDDSTSARWGPRFPEFIETVADAVQRARATGSDG